VKASRGRLIVFEGVDAAGKTTLCEELCVSLRRECRIARHCRFPGTRQGTLGELVYRIHHFHSSEFGVPTIDPCSLQLLHIAAHVDAIESEIKPALRDGEWVVLDRFWWSTYVYGLDDGVQESQLQLMIDVEKSAWGAILPDILFLVDSATPLRDDETNSYAWQRKRQTYNRLAAREDYIQKCVRLETGQGDNVKHRVMAEIREAVAALRSGTKGSCGVDQ
jgi:dTMP kinase